MSEHYILKGKKAVKVDLITWAKWFEYNHDKRRVAHDIIREVEISTVFLGLDHRFGEGPPLIFETMIFGGEHSEYQCRYTAYFEAMDGHRRAVLKVMRSFKVLGWFNNSVFDNLEGDSHGEKR